MSFRAWVYAIALGITFYATLGKAQEQAPETEEQPDAQQGKAEALPIPFPVEIVEDEAAAEARQRSEEESRQREIEDLLAQQGMNAATQSIDAATQDMRDYALYSTWLVAVGTVMLGITLWLTRQANRAATRAAEVTRDVGEAQVRAYLFCKDARYKRSKDGFVVEVTLGNAGQSPAKDVSITGNLSLHWVGGFGDRPRVLAYAIIEQDWGTRFPMIGSGGVATEQMYFSKDSLSFQDNHAASPADIFDDTNQIYFDGVVSWSDVFGNVQSFDLSLAADVSATPWNQQKKKSRSGVLRFRADNIQSGPGT